MVTIFIAEDEKNVKELLSQVLRREGYNISDSVDENSGIIKIISRGSVTDIDSLKDNVVKLEDSLYKEKKGSLYKTILETVEKPLIEHMLERTEGNQLKAARILGINRNTMRTKIKKLNIDVSRWKV